MTWTYANTRMCSTCRRTKPLEHFALSKRVRSGRSSVCRVCDAVRQQSKRAALRATNPDGHYSPGGTDWTKLVRLELYPGRDEPSLTPAEHRVIMRVARLCAKVRDAGRVRRQRGYCQDCGNDCARAELRCTVCRSARTAAARVLRAYPAEARQRVAPRMVSETRSNSARAANDRLRQNNRCADCGIPCVHVRCTYCRSLANRRKGHAA